MPINHNQFLQEIDDTTDTTNNIIQLIQLKNDLSTYFLREHSFNSDVFEVAIKKVKSNCDSEAFLRAN
jgi:hypothetical protein